MVVCVAAVDVISRTLYRRTRDNAAPRSSNRSVLGRAAAPNSPRHSTNGSVTRCRDPRTQRPRVASRAGLSREQRQPLESPGNGATTWNATCGREMENRKNRVFPLVYSNKPRFGFPPHAPNPLGPQPRKGRPPPAHASKIKTSKQWRRCWTGRSSDGQRGRGRRASRPRPGMWPTAAVAAGVAVRWARGRSRGGGGRHDSYPPSPLLVGNKSPDWEKSSASRTRVPAMSNQSHSDE